VKKIVLSALAVAALAGAANAQTIEFRWTERHGQNSIGAGALPIAGDPNNAGTVSDATLFLSLEARVVGGGALGVSTFGGTVLTNDAFNPVRNTGGNAQGFFSAPNIDGSAAGTQNAWARATSTFNTSYGAWVNGDGDTLAGGRGIFNPYRQIANLGTAANGIVDDTDLGTDGLQLPAVNSVINLFGNMAEADYSANVANFEGDAFIPLFIVRYDVTDLSARQLTFTYDGFITAFSGFVEGAPVEALTVEVTPTYTVNIVPAPGAAALLGLGGLLAARRRRA
jgi:hypothetical protein